MAFVERLKRVAKIVAEVIGGVVTVAVVLVALWVAWRIVDYFNGEECHPSDYVECEYDPNAGLP